MKSEIRFMYILAALLLSASVALASWFVYQYTGKNSRANEWKQITEEKPEAKPPCLERSMINGRCIQTSEALEITAVMIDNHPNARPSAGLAEAAIVYEAPVEGNFTRFLALYPRGAAPEKVGPIRSARPYFLDWAREWGTAMLMHIGGSPEALVALENDHELVDINEYYRGWYFWRENGSAAPPHNAYTSRTLWDKAWNDYGKTRETEFVPWSFDDGTPCENDCTERITIDFVKPWFSVEWQFVSSSRQYMRLQAGEPHTEQDGSAIYADTVIIQYVQLETIDDIGRKHIATDESGKTVVIADGYATEGRWVYENGRTLWTRDDGAPLPLKPGTIWIEVVTRGTDIQFD